MTIDVYTADGKKKGTMELPVSLFGDPMREGLMHLALIRQQSNRRKSVAHARNRGEMQGSTRKLYQQKGTGRARRGPLRSPLMRGGGKPFGPRSDRNTIKEMPRKARHAAIRSCLSFALEQGRALALESFNGKGKTKEFVALLDKLPVSKGRKIVFVLPGRMESLERSARNVSGVKTLFASYLNPEDLLGAHHVVFLTEAIHVAEKLFGKGKEQVPSPKS